MKKYKIVKESYKGEIRFYIYHTLEHARETVERLKNTKSEVIK